MTLAQAHAEIERLIRELGADTPLYFDCPDCRRSFTPDMAQAERRVTIGASAVKPPTGGQ